MAQCEIYKWQYITNPMNSLEQIIPGLKVAERVKQEKLGKAFPSHSSSLLLCVIFSEGLFQVQHVVLEM